MVQKQQNHRKIGITISLILVACVAARFCFVNLGKWLVVQEKRKRSKTGYLLS